MVSPNWKEALRKAQKQKPEVIVLEPTMIQYRPSKEFKE